jgi:DNA mismatch repair protein MutS
MAHAGCYVPATHATIRATDKLFTRIAVDESVEENKSTFMAEMKETSYIIESLTPNSLVIIDELGRGKSHLHLNCLSQPLSSLHRI